MNVQRWIDTSLKSKILKTNTTIYSSSTLPFDLTPSNPNSPLDQFRQKRVSSKELMIVMESCSQRLKRTYLICRCLDSDQAISCSSAVPLMTSSSDGLLRENIDCFIPPFAHLNTRCLPLTIYPSHPTITPIHQPKTSRAPYLDRQHLSHLTPRQVLLIQR